MLKPCLPLELEVIPRVVDDLVKGRGFGGTSPVVLELWRIAERDSGQASARAMRLRSSGLYVSV